VLKHGAFFEVDYRTFDKVRGSYFNAPLCPCSEERVFLGCGINSRILSQLRGNRGEVYYLKNTFCQRVGKGTCSHPFEKGSHKTNLISKDFFVSPNSGNNDPNSTSHIGSSIVHRYAKCPLFSSLQLFISQTWIGWICGQSFELLPESNSYFFRKVIQSF